MKMQTWCLQGCIEINTVYFITAWMRTTSWWNGIISFLSDLFSLSSAGKYSSDLFWLSSAGKYSHTSLLSRAIWTLLRKKKSKMWKVIMEGKLTFPLLILHGWPLASSLVWNERDSFFISKANQSGKKPFTIRASQENHFQHFTELVLHL